jgi:chromosome segregation ATPase
MQRSICPAPVFSFLVRLVIYLDDITKNFLDQNQVINAQRKENDKLKKTVADIAREVGDIEQDSSQTHSELERLKSLSGQLKTDVATRRISQSEVAGILDQVKGLQGKPGMSSEEYQELKQKVAEFKKGEVDPKQFEELKNRLERMGNQKSVDKGDFERLQALMSKVEQGQADNEKTKGNVDAKLAAVERKQAEIERKEVKIEKEKKLTLPNKKRIK